MAMMSQLLDKMKPKTLEQRIAELPSLSMEALTLITQGEEAESLRIAAVAYLTDCNELTALTVTDKAPKLQQTAKLRMASLIDDGSITLDEFTQRDIDGLTQLSIVGFCASADILTQLLNTYSDAEFLYQVAIEGVPARVRELAAAKIEDANQLKQLLKATRGKDKLVYKIVKDKCDQLREQEKQAEQIQAEIGDLCERLEAHSKRPFDKQFMGRASRMIAAWTDLESASSEPLKSQAQQAITLCKQTIDAHELELANIAASKAANEAAEASFGQVVDQLYSLLSQVYGCDGNADEVASIQSQHSAHIEQWNKALALASANNASVKAFTLANEGVKQQLQLLSEFGSLQSQLALLTADAVQNKEQSEEKKVSGQQAAYKKIKVRLQAASVLPSTMVPEQVNDARKILADNDKYWADKKQAESDRQRHINALISQANQALQNGLSRDAAGIRRTLERKLGALEKLPAAITAKVEQLDEALSKLLDWKNFAVEPKQQEDIIEELEQLKQKDIDAEGKKAIIAKDDVKKVIGRSPDYRDMLLMREYFEIKPVIIVAPPRSMGRRYTNED